MARRQLLPIFVAPVLISRLLASSPAIPDCKVGDAASVDVISPTHLIVIDHDRTQQLRHEEGQRSPTIFRFYPAVSDEVEASFRSDFASAREKFLSAVEASYAKRTLSEATVELPRFQRVVASFEKERNLFPVNTDLARLWALGDSGESIQSNWVARVREVMERPIRTDPLPAEARKGPRQITLISLKAKDVPVDLAYVELQGTSFPRTNIYGLGHVREALQASFPPEERGVGAYLASLLKENCFFDGELTRQRRAKRTETLWAADEYQAGQLIVKRGEIVDARIKTVLDQLRERTGTEQAKAEPPKEQPVPPAAPPVPEPLQLPTTSIESAVPPMREANGWVFPAIVCISVAFPLAIWSLSRRKPSHSLLPGNAHRAQITGAVISCPACTSAIVVPFELTGPISVPATIASTAPPAAPDSQTDAPSEADARYWKERALAAENRIEKANGALRSGLIPYLARYWLGKLASRLVHQRAQLLETQQKAEQELSELEARLASVQAPLEQRLRAYEDRIAELEQDLTAKGKENRHLVEATIAMAKKKLKIERSKDRLDEPVKERS